MTGESEMSQATELESDNSDIFDTIVVGAGAAGIGVGIALAHSGVGNFVIIDKGSVGSSFASWPDETRFITPSFPSNSIGMLDLNSIAVGVSPAYNMRIEHPTGSEYAQHLQDLAKFFELPVRENAEVTEINHQDGLFSVETNDWTILSKNVIWAAGEFLYPRLDGFPGSELCRHTATLTNYADLDGDDFLIIGGYESGVDAAYHLSKRGKKVNSFLQDCERMLSSGKAHDFFTDEFRSVVGLDDVLRILHWAIDGGAGKSPGVYNMGGPQRLSRVDLAAAVASYLDRILDAPQGQQHQHGRALTLQLGPSRSGTR